MMKEKIQTAVQAMEPELSQLADRIFDFNEHAFEEHQSCALLEEFLEAKAGRKQALAKFQKAIPWTVERLRAGEPFPEWDSWEKIDK